MCARQSRVWGTEMGTRQSLSKNGNIGLLLLLNCWWWESFSKKNQMITAFLHFPSSSASDSTSHLFLSPYSLDGTRLHAMRGSDRDELFCHLDCHSVQGTIAVISNNWGDPCLSWQETYWGLKDSFPSRHSINIVHLSCDFLFLRGQDWIEWKQLEEAFSARSSLVVEPFN